jgi:hypothetical protein
MTPQQQSESALLLHTDPIDQNGTDLFAVREALFGLDSNVYFTNRKLETKDMNLLYNIADVTTLTFDGNETAPTPVNFNGVFSFLRFKTNASPISITKILIRN